MNKIGRLGGIVAAAFCLGAGTNPGTDQLPPLVRRDLIRTAVPVFPKILRNPFSTILFVSDSTISPKSPEMGGPPANEPPPPPPATVRYVGFIKYAAQQTLVAIVLINGRAWAVSEGESIGNGWSALKISDKSIELRNPEGNNLVFMYEGERP
jgi:hypothetical protein